MAEQEERVLGPEILGPRLTVYHLLSSFMDPDVTEAEICREYNLTAQQVSAARAYMVRNPDTVLAQHLKIEERIAVGNPPEVREMAGRAMATFKKFKEWLAKRDAENRQFDQLDNEERSGRAPTFKEWMAVQGQS